MIAIVTKGKDRRRIFRFVCKQCGCVYDATEDEGVLITETSKTTGTYVGFYSPKVSMELECPMAFCRCKNTSFNIMNKEELEK